jgi:hypothetical protein
MKAKIKIKSFIIPLSLLIIFSFTHCKEEPVKMTASENSYKIVFLHHSTGWNIWNGNTGAWNPFQEDISVPIWFVNYNQQNGTDYYIEEKVFPKAEPYGWNNYPYDYYNIWVKNAGNKPYMGEPTLEMLTDDFDMIIFKHCFPVSAVEEDSGFPDPDSPLKKIENYKMQYDSLKVKMHNFPDTKFIVWTGAALTENNTTPDQAKRAKDFFSWVKNHWDQENDNIFIWDFYELQTEGDLYFKNKYARKKNNPHPNSNFSAKTAQLFSQRIVDVIETKGEKTELTGMFIQN